MLWGCCWACCWACCCCCCWNVVWGLLCCCELREEGCGSVVGLLSCWDVVGMFLGVLLGVLVVVAVLVLLRCCGHVLRCSGVLLWMFC